jgi:hypothetical protein
MPSYSRKVDVPGRSAQELYDKVAADIERFLGKASIPVKMDIDRDASKKEVRVKSSMFSATLACKDAQLVLDGQLSLMAMPFRSKLDEGINQWLAKAFPPRA